MAILNNLIVNGASRFLNKTYFDTLEADTGRFNKLATKVLGSDGTTITVYGLMDVQGELHTKSWTNSNIATIDGSFYICPTLKVTETGSTTNGLTITQSNDTWSVQITSSSAVVTNSVYTMNSSGTVTSTGTWSLGSKVAITGEILVNNEWIPLGTLRGRLTQRSSDLKSVTISSITDGSSSSNNILNTIGPQSNVKHRNVKISLYEWTLSDSGTPTTATTNPIGIYMTALGDGNGQTMIDIYGGQEPNSSTYKGLAKPYVRIGNLSGLSNLTVGGQNPKGWGIYTSNGYFEGTIAARRGYIGNNTKYWTIGTSGTNSTIFSGPTTVSATGTAGTYLGTDGFLNTASSSVYAQITNGILTAKGVDITGKITASSGSIAGWRIESSYLASGSATTPAANVLLLSPSGTTNSYTIASQAKTGWMITAGTTFGVNKDGGIYATSGKIGGWDITASSIQTGNYNTASTMYFGTSGLSLGTTFKVSSAGELTATGATLKTVKLTDNDNKERVIVNTNGLTVKDASGNTVANLGTVASSTSTMTLGQVASGKYNIYLDNGGIKLRYNTTVLNLIDSTGMTLKDSSDSTLAEFKSYINLGTEHTNTYTGSAVIGVGLTTAKTNQVVVGRYNESNSSATFIIGNGTGTAEANRSNILEVGENEITIGNSDASHTVLDSNGQRIYASNGTTKIAQLGYGQGSDASGYAIAPFYEFGTRKANTAPGNYSVLEGDDLIATGFASRVHGKCAEAKQSLSNVSGLGVSDACGEIFYVDGNGEEVYEYDNGGLISVIGTYNKPSDDSPLVMNYTIDESNITTMSIRRNPYVFVIGNGTSDSHRSNALTVDWDGNVESAGKTTHVCYINSITSTTISAQNTVKKIPIEAIGDYNDANKYFAYDSSAKGVKIVKNGVYIISVQAGVNPATSGDLMGLNIYRNGSNVIGPEYRRVGGNYDTVILAPTVITLNAGDILTLYGRNNTSGRGTFTSCRFTIHRI